MSPEKGVPAPGGWVNERARETLCPPHHPSGQVQAAVFPGTDTSSTPSRKNTCCGSPTGSPPGSHSLLIHKMGIKERGPSDVHGRSSTHGRIEEVLYFPQLGSSSPQTEQFCPNPQRKCYKKFLGGAAAVGNNLMVPQKVNYRIIP